MDVYAACPFYTTLTKFGKFDVKQGKRQKINKAASDLQEVYHIDDQSFSYSSATKATKSQINVNFVHYKPAPDPLNQMAKDEAVREKGDAILQKAWREEFDTCANFMEHRPAFWKSSKNWGGCKTEIRGILT